MNLVDLSALTESDVREIWRLAAAPDVPLTGTVAWSFEGNGIRTRATFIEAFRHLGLQFTELPNLLKTGETTRDLAGYLDPFFCLYVIRDSNHARLAEFAGASTRPVVNAMSSQGHPCEVLTDAYFVHSALKDIQSARVCLWGPTTNVFRSWHELAAVFDVELIQVCEKRFHEDLPNVTFVEAAVGDVDVVITDAWPAGVDTYSLPLTGDDVRAMGSPALLPTPPFTVGRELLIDPLAYPGFTGYQQKALLLPVHKAIIRYVTEV